MMTCAFDSVVSSNRSKKSIDKKAMLELDNILVWEVSSNNSRDYFISIQSDNNKRIMVGSSKKERTVISEYQRRGFDIRCFSVFYAMSERELEFYNSSLNIGEYDTCVLTLFSLELQLNSKYGYHKGLKVYCKQHN